MAATIPPGDPRRTSGDEPGPEEQENEVAADDADSEGEGSADTPGTDEPGGSRSTRVG